MSSSSKPQPSKSKPSTTTSSKTSPGKTQTGKTETPPTKSKPHEARKEHGHGHSHGGGGVSVGVSVNIPLERIGQRPVEDDPWAVSGGGPPVAHTQEKPEKPKRREKQHEITTPSAFANISVTGPEAKEESQPPGPINVSDDNETPPTLPKDEVFHAPTMEDLKNARNAYDTAWKKFLEPYVNRLLASYDDAMMDEEILKLRAKFGQSDEGNKLFEDWMKTYKAVNKAGAQIPDELVPPNELEKAKHDLAQAQKAADTQRDVYDTQKNKAVADSPGVKSIQSEIDALKKKVHYSDKEVQADKEKVKKLEAELENIKKQVAKEWTSSDEATDQMKKVQEAEYKLNSAKKAYKPFEQFEEKPKAASNP